MGHRRNGGGAIILEIAMLQVVPGKAEAFESDFRIASKIISSMNGYVRHELQRCLETENKYALLVWRETLEDHTVGFRGSAEYETWRKLLHHYDDPFPTVEHFVKVELRA